MVMPMLTTLVAASDEQRREGEKAAVSVGKQRDREPEVAAAARRTDVDQEGLADAAVGKGGIKIRLGGLEATALLLRERPTSARRRSGRTGGGKAGRVSAACKSRGTQRERERGKLLT